MSRIKLTDENVKLYPFKDVSFDTGVRYFAGIYVDGLEDKTNEMEQLKKQILEDYEFSESMNVKLDENGNIVSIPIKELKDKAEKYKTMCLQCGYCNLTGIEIFSRHTHNCKHELAEPDIHDRFEELEQQVKQLQEELEELDNKHETYRQYLQKENQSNKQIIEKIREYTECLTDEQMYRNKDIRNSIRKILGEIWK